MAIDEAETFDDHKDLEEMGREWDAAIELCSQLAKKRTGFSYNAFRSMNPGIDAVGNALRRLQETKKLDILKKAKQRAQRDTALRIRKETAPITVNKLMEQILSRIQGIDIQDLAAEKELCGQALILAWLNEDVHFFKTLAEAATIAFGVRRKLVGERQIQKDVTKMELLIRAAVALWHDDFCNPSRERVMSTLKSDGVVIRPKDQSSYFKRCNLGFLKSEKGRGRPAAKKANIKQHVEKPFRVDVDCDGFGKPPGDCQ